MPSFEDLKVFIADRLATAAEEIFREFEKTVVKYEEEIDRQRTLLDITWKPVIKLHRIGTSFRCGLNGRDVENDSCRVLIRAPSYIYPHFRSVLGGSGPEIPRQIGGSRWRGQRSVCAGLCR